MGKKKLIPAPEVISRTTYSALYDAIATAFNVDDNSDIFILPDLRQKVKEEKSMSQQDYIDDLSNHRSCRICGYCLECQDCAEFGCRIPERISEKINELYDWTLEFGE